MRVKTLVVTPQQFSQFVKKQLGAGTQTAAAPGAKPTAAAGKAVFTGQGGCSACHTLSDANSTGTVGPDLDHVVADAKKYAKGQSPQAYIKQSIEDPNAFVVPKFPKGTMPQNFKSSLGPQKIDALVQYLLQAGGK